MQSIPSDLESIIRSLNLHNASRFGYVSSWLFLVLWLLKPPPFLSSVYSSLLLSYIDFIYDYVWLGFFPQQAGRRPEELSSLADVRWFPNRICDEFQIPLCKKNISSFHEFALIFAVSLHSHCFLLRYMGLLCLIKSLTTKGRSRWRTFMAPTPVCRSPGKKKRGRPHLFSEWDNSDMYCENIWLLKIVLSKTTGSISTILCTNHSWVKWIVQKKGRVSSKWRILTKVLENPKLCFKLVYFSCKRWGP